jgi:hypothetical protein
MKASRILKSTIIAIAAAALLTAFVPGSVYAQERGLPLPGMNGNGFIPGIPLPNLNDPGTANLVGSFLGSFLGTMIVNNQYQDEHRYYDDYNRYGNRGYDYRHYVPNDRRYYNRSYRGYDRDGRW